MSNETVTKKVVAASMTPPVSVSRNGIDEVFTQDEYGKKSPMVGRKFFTPIFSQPEVKDLTLSDGSTVRAITGKFVADVEWVGVSDYISMENKLYRRIFMDIDSDNVDEESGLFDTEGWKRDAAKFTEGAVTLSEVEENIDKLETVNNIIINHEKFTGDMADTNAFTIDDYDTTARTQAEWFQQVVKPNGGKITSLKKQANEISARYEARAAKRKKKEKKTTDTGNGQTESAPQVTETVTA